MPALVAGIHVLTLHETKTWMGGTSPAMTDDRFNSTSRCFMSRFSDPAAVPESIFRP